MINEAQIFGALRDDDQIEAIKELLADAWTEGAEADNEYMEKHCYWSEHNPDGTRPEPMPPANPYEQ